MHLKQRTELAIALKIIYWALIISSGCALFTSRIEHAMTLAKQGNLQPMTFQTDSFRIYGFQRFSDPLAPLTIYLEGDGAAWKSKNRLAADPTPKNPLALKLAVQDSAANILYLARPCQYVSSKQCTPQYWSSHRYSPAIRNAINQAIDQARQMADSSQIILIGYSGGGTLATLLAAQRQDVCQLITIAANLDIYAWTQHHKVTPLWGSDSPIDHATTLQHIRQIHLVGELDTIVPQTIAQSYMDALPDSSTSRMIVVKDVNHYQGWDRQWPILLQERGDCH